MNYVDLPDVRGIIRGFNLRIEAAKAISQIEMAARNGADVSQAGNALWSFFTACTDAAYAAGQIGRPVPDSAPSGGGKKAAK